MTKVGKIIQREIEEAVDKKEKEMEEVIRKKEAEVKEKENEVRNKEKALLDAAKSLLDLLPPEQIAEKFNLPIELILNQDIRNN